MIDANFRLSSHPPQEQLYEAELCNLPNELAAVHTPVGGTSPGPGKEAERFIWGSLSL